MQIKTDRLYIRQVTDEDFELISLIWRDWIPAFLRDNEAACNGLCHKLWEDMKDPVTLTGIIFLRDRNRFCGRVNMQKIDEEVPELGIDILREYQNQGYGPEAIAAFANWYGENRHISKIKVRVSAANAHSAHVFQKLGAQYKQEDPSFLSVAKRLTESLPEKRETIMRDLSVREYILKLPISYP